MAYITKEHIEDYLQTLIDGSMDSRIDEWISAAENYVERYTGRKFEDSGSDETRYYDGDGTTILNVDEFTAITSIDILEIDGDDSEYSLTFGKGNDYILFPYNDVPPYYRLIMLPTSQVGTWLSGRKRIKVVGRFRYQSSVPADIKLAVTQLVSHIMDPGRLGSEGGIQSEALGDYSVTYGRLDDAAEKLGVKKILDSYKLLEL